MGGIGIARAGAAFALALAAVVGLGATGAEAAVPVQGCPAGTVCLYGEGGGWSGGHPTFVLYRDSVYSLSGQYGTHRVLNNRDTGLVRVCGPGPGVPGGCVEVRPHEWADVLAPTLLVVMS